MSASKDTPIEADWWWETGKIVIQALAIAMIVRVFLYQPFNIPSGSMKKTLLVGDYLFVSKLSYGYSNYSFPHKIDLSTFRIPVSIPVLPAKLFSGRILAGQPKRGDVVVFRLPRDDQIDYIKRVVGLPGDTIEVKGGVLFINGAEVTRRPTGEFSNVECEESRQWCKTVRYKTYEETLPEGLKYTVLDLWPSGPADNAGPFKVPAGNYFMMGDNRDNSTDSRFSAAEGGVGFVPFENFIGRAEIIFFSASDEPDAFRWYKPWAWPFDIRWSRFFNLVR